MKVVLCISVTLALICHASAAKLPQPIALSVINGDLQSLKDDCISGSISKRILLKYDDDTRFEIKLREKGHLAIDGDVTVALSQDPTQQHEEQTSGSLYFDCSTGDFYKKANHTIYAKAYRYITRYDRPKKSGNEDEKRISYTPAEVFVNEILSAARGIARSARGEPVTQSHKLRNGQTVKIFYNPHTEIASVLGRVHVVFLRDNRMEHSTCYNSVQFSLVRNSSNQIHSYLGAYAVRPE